ncbi:chondroitin 4-O-sulfotransferase [Paraburkholderia sp. Ac-20347]|uniref:chondroitin 4-O-sulfotransferase n=1 Tax=Paraburkholderia sp. Ac-20347 TaxID=2703892 RepID=UPI00197F5E4D|nr:chondroitin 4-O-sulfotransferase [Paraburkholderia sp. Ac-20347]MBN3808178.1 sulfotransferase family protein [Paraburkholderia sp. Ac-20347]
MYPIFFVHPPKSGGSSVLSFFAINNGPEGFARFVWDEPGWPAMMEELRRTGVGGGHQNYGFHVLNKTPLDYVTIFRDPLQRQISHYWYAVTGKNGDIEQGFASISHAEALVRAGRITLDDWVAGSHDGGNIFVKMLSGRAVADDEAFCLAKENIEHRFLAVGDCADVSEFLLLLCARSKFDLPFYFPTNVTKAGGEKRVPVSQWAKDKFAADNALDYKLFDFAKAQLAEDIKSLGEGFLAALEAVRKVQDVINRLENPYRYASSESGFDGGYIAEVREVILQSDLTAINDFLASARSRYRETGDFVDGTVDSVEHGVVSGWALNLARPESIVELEILAGGRVVATGRTGAARPDVAAAGYMSSNTGFRIELPPEAGSEFVIRVVGSHENIRGGGHWFQGWHRA